MRKFYAFSALNYGSLSDESGSPMPNT